MMGHTHLLIGEASWLGALTIANVSGSLPLTLGVLLGGTAVASLGAIEPDIDSKRSIASNLLGPVTRAISFVVRKAFGGHRTITHSLLGMALVDLFAFGMQRWLHFPIWISAAFVVGWISHVLADMLTKEGCPLFWPISDHDFGLHLVTTGLSKKQGRHTSEWWVVRPLAVLASGAFLALLAMGI
jgi:membrane-bound metal-dependent hydrolase YbcI (DUF457 family)